MKPVGDSETQYRKIPVSRDYCSAAITDNNSTCQSQKSNTFRVEVAADLRLIKFNMPFSLLLRLPKDQNPQAYKLMLREGTSLRWLNGV